MSQQQLDQSYDRALVSTLDQALNGYGARPQNQHANQVNLGNGLSQAEPPQLGNSHHHPHHQSQQQQQHVVAPNAAVAAAAIANITIPPLPGRRNNNNNNNVGGNVNNNSRPSHRINKPGHKFGAKKKSWVWNWFVQDANDINVATCDECGKTIERLPSDKGSPKKLSEHLKTHKIDKHSTNPRRPHIIPVNAVNNNVPTNQVIYSDHVSRSSGSAPSDIFIDNREFDDSPYSQIKIHKDIMRFLSENKLPINIVKTYSFRQLIYTLRPESVYDLNELNTLYSSLMQVIKNENNQVHHQHNQPQHQQQQQQQQQPGNPHQQDHNDHSNLTNHWM